MYILLKIINYINIKNYYYIILLLKLGGFKIENKSLEKKRVSFRIEESLLEKFKKHSKAQGYKSLGKAIVG